jgi:hypothetical protein
MIIVSSGRVTLPACGAFSSPACREPAKSSALVELSNLGFQVIDTDEPGWTEWSEREDGVVWREDRIADLLTAAAPNLHHRDRRRATPGQHRQPPRGARLRTRP